MWFKKKSNEDIIKAEIIREIMQREDAYLNNKGPEVDQEYRKVIAQFVLRKLAEKNKKS